MTDAMPRLTAALEGRYRIERELGAGGMATVYLAEDIRHRRHVAVKVLSPDLAAALGAERFQREIEIAARLRHPHILPLYDSGEADGLLYYVMPLAEGESLRERLMREKQLPIEDAVRIAREVSDALSYAHSHGVLHRDIKPENILLESGHAVVADFGIAKAISAAGGQTLTGTGMAIGTPAYMSPEQAAGEKDLDGRSDLYALGCVLYEMLAGQPPFTGPTSESIVRQHMAVEAPSIRGIRPAVPDNVAAAIQRALAKTPADRFNPVALFGEALGEAGARTHGRTDAPSKRTALPAYRLTALVAAAIAMAWVGWRALRPGEQSIAFANGRQITREPALEIQAAISPDGREVAYASGYPGSTRIEVRDISGGRPRSLTGDWRGVQVQPRWMPDGRSIRFINIRTTADHGAGVWEMPRMGGQAVAAGPGATVMVAGHRTLEVRGDSAFARNTDGSATLLFADARRTHSAAWSSDGARLAFVQGNYRFVDLAGLGSIGPSSISVVTVGDTAVRVTDSASLNVSPVWLPDGRLLFVSNRDGPRDLYVVRPAGAGRPLAVPVRLTTGLEAYSVSVSADGATIAYDRFLFRRNIYSLPVPRIGSVSIREARPLTQLNQTTETVRLSGDGQWLVFDSNLEGNQDVFVMPAAGGEPRRVTRDSGNESQPDISPNGREIVFVSARSGARDIYLINSDGTGEQRLTSGTNESYYPAFSPDGLHIAYSQGPGGIYVLRRGAIGGVWSAPERLVPDAYYPRWSADGTRLAFTRAPGTAGMGGRVRGLIGTVTLGGAERTLIEGHADGLQPLLELGWSADDRMVYFLARTPAGTRGIYEIPAAGGSPRLLVRSDPAMDENFGAIGNGRFYFAIGEMESDIHVMDVVRR